MATTTPQTMRDGVLPVSYSWEFMSAPLDLDEAEREHVRTLEQWRAGDYFKVKVRVKHQICFTSQQQPIQELYSSETTMLLSSQRFLEDGASFIRWYYPHPLISNELFPAMMPQVMSCANALVQGQGCGSRPQFRLLSLVLDVVDQFTYDERYHDAIIDLIGAYDRGYARVRTTIVTDNFTGIVPVPASKTAIQSLKKVKLQNQNGAVLETCSICLSEFVDGMEVSALPCEHLYHHQCITQWLGKSHMCPLCRYEMPTPDN